MNTNVVRGQAVAILFQRARWRRRLLGSRGTLHTARAARQCRSGVSLLEVLIAMFVLSIGLLGVASLIPIGKLALVETNKSDRGGACGRAALREVKARRMLNENYLDDPKNRGSSPNVYVIDPLGAINGLDQTNFGGTRTVGISVSPTGFSNIFPLPRFSLTNASTFAEKVFRWHDDLLYVLPKDYKTTPTNGDRPMPVTDSGLGAQGSDPSFSWFLTVMPSNQSGLYTVSAVVCYKRDFSVVSSQPAGEQTVDITFKGSVSYGGGTVELSNVDTTLNDPINRVKTNQWVMLLGWADSGGQRSPSYAQWYRVAGVNRQDASKPDSPVTMLSLVGPDWPTNSVGGKTIKATSLVAVDGVIGVYSALIKLDDDELWVQ
ncbi:MAG: prepilin-type N-terminal cleavage/methylation domain-containing protein [Thermoguttaceae bacterium]